MQDAVLRIVTEMPLPPFGPFILLLFALLIRPRFRRLGFALAVIATSIMWLCSTVAFSELLQPPVPQSYDPIMPPYAPADAIVILGAGRYFEAPEYNGQDTASVGTLVRLRYGAKLARETGKPILVSGGMPMGFGARSEAEIMREILEDEYQLPVAWVEPTSTTTAENALESASLLRAAGIRTIYLVTQHSHMGRAQTEFERHSIQVVPMPTLFPQAESATPLAWLPTFRGLKLTRAALYERLAPYWPF